MYSLVYYIIKLFNKKAALNYALDRQIKSMKYWHNKVIDHGIKEKV